VPADATIIDFIGDGRDHGDGSAGATPSDVVGIGPGAGGEIGIGCADAGGAGRGSATPGFVTGNAFGAAGGADGGIPGDGRGMPGGADVGFTVPMPGSVVIERASDRFNSADGASGAGGGASAEDDDSAAISGSEYCGSVTSTSTGLAK
jgi:hypothetical protein